MANSVFNQIERINPDMVDAEIRDLETALRLVEKGLRNAPKGRVEISKSNDTYGYISFAKGSWGNKTRTKKYIPIRSTQAFELAQRKYFELLKPLLDQELAALRKFKETYNPNCKFEVTNRFPHNIQNLISPIFISNERWQSTWSKELFECNSIEINTQNRYATKNGEYVRSKAELIIANMLYDLGLLYRYECAYHGDYWTTYPDFTIVHPKTGELYYLEYFGLMDDPDYKNSALKKIARYQQTSDANRFIFLFESESSPMDINTIENILRRFFF